jgi:hypothetical protein
VEVYIQASRQPYVIKHLEDSNIVEAFDEYHIDDLIGSIMRNWKVT